MRFPYASAAFQREWEERQIGIPANLLYVSPGGELVYPLPKEWIAQLMNQARACGAKLSWVNCGLCVDERGVAEAVEGVRRGSPADCWKMAQESRSTLVIATK